MAPHPQADNTDTSALPGRAAINGAVRSEHADPFSFKHLLNIHHVTGGHFYVGKNTNALPK